MKKSILIGINKYPVNYTLEGCQNDVTLWEDVLRIKFGFITKKKYDLLKQEVLDQLQLLVSSLEKGDIGVFFFSGHGVRRHDDSDKYNEGIVATDKVIWDYEIDKFKKRVKKDRKLILIFDTCHSEGVFEPHKFLDFERIGLNYMVKSIPVEDMEFPSVESNEDEGLVMREVNGDSVITLAACGKYKQAYEKQFGEMYNGVFSHYATQILLRGNENINFGNFLDLVNTEIKDKENVEQVSVISDYDLKMEHKMF
ncbi:caspase family protein [Aquimarina macrocephali]|uniref:caspase family protein n=1 Tax=Aquimarina macrocephali TaxID=666563 RepID=UPI0004675B6E|nr:caspase family protein [Aquimarina macrocephali]